MANKVEVQLTARDNISRPLDGVAGKLQRLRIQVESNSGAMKKLNSGFEDIAKSAISANGPMGKFADSLMAFGPGGFATGAVVAGFGIMLTLYKNLEESTKDLKAAKNELANAFIARSGQLASSEKALSDAILESEKATKELEDATNSWIGTAAQANVWMVRLANNFGLIGTAAQYAAKWWAQTKINQLDATEDRAQAAQESARQANVRALIAELSTLESLRKARNLTNKEQQQYNSLLRQVAHLQFDSNSQIALAATNASKLTTETKKVVESKRDEIEILLRANAQGILSIQQQGELNRLLQVEQSILGSSNATLERRIQAQDRLTQNENLQNAALERARRANEERNNALIAAVNLNVRSEELSGRLVSALAEEEIKLSALAPLTAEWAEQLQRVTNVRDALNKALETTSLDEEINNLVASSRFGGSAELRDRLTDALSVVEDKLRTLTPYSKEWIDEMNKASTIAQAIDEVNASLDVFSQNLENIRNTDFISNMTDQLTLASDAWQLLFESIASGGSAFETFSRGAARLIAQYAKGQAATNIAEAVQNSARGAAALANPITSGAAPGFFKAAGLNIKAAALWGVAAGAAGGFGGRSSGGAGGGASNSSFGEREIERQGDVTIVFPEGLIDLTNPNTQRQFSKLINQVAGNRQVNFAGA